MTEKEVKISKNFYGNFSILKVWWFVVNWPKWHIYERNGCFFLLVEIGALLAKTLEHSLMGWLQSGGEKEENILTGKDTFLLL